MDLNQHKMAHERYLATTVLIVSTQVSSSFWSDVLGINVKACLNLGNLEIIEYLKQILGTVASSQPEYKLLLAVVACCCCQAVVQPHCRLRRLEASRIGCSLLILVTEKHQVSQGKMEHFPAPLPHLCLFVIGIVAGLPHDIPSLVVDRRVWVWQAEEWIYSSNLLSERDI